MWRRLGRVGPFVFCVVGFGLGGATTVYAQQQFDNEVQGETVTPTRAKIQAVDELAKEVDATIAQTADVADQLTNETQVWIDANSEMGKEVEAAAAKYLKEPTQENEAGLLTVVASKCVQARRASEGLSGACGTLSRQVVILRGSLDQKMEECERERVAVLVLSKGYQASCAQAKKAFAEVHELVVKGGYKSDAELPREERMKARKLMVYITQLDLDSQVTEEMANEVGQYETTLKDTGGLLDDLEDTADYLAVQASSNEETLGLVEEFVARQSQHSLITYAFRGVRRLQQRLAGLSGQADRTRTNLKGVLNTWRGVRKAGAHGSDQPPPQVGGSDDVLNFFRSECPIGKKDSRKDGQHE